MRDDKLSIGLRLPFRLKADKNGFHIASCEALDVHSQGESAPHAAGNLAEAIELFIETCREMGTLDEIFRKMQHFPEIVSISAPEKKAAEKKLEVVPDINSMTVTMELCPQDPDSEDMIDGLVAVWCLKTEEKCPIQTLSRLYF